MTRIGLGSVRAGPVLFACLLVAPLHAQQVLLSAHGQYLKEDLGTAISVGPDLDGDGFAEIAVGATGLHIGAKMLGGALILSGRDFSVLNTIYGARGGDLAGKALAWCGDVDNDGVADLAVGAPTYAATIGGTLTGQVRIHSGQTGSVIRSIPGSTDRGWFGASLANLGDVNGDGVDDLLVGAPYDIIYPSVSGPCQVQICSGSDGSALQTINGAPGAEFGFSVANLGDLDADGVNDFAVGAPHADGPHVSDKVGSVHVHSGATGALLLQVDGSEGKCNGTYSGYSFSYYTGDQLGTSTGAAGDFDGDGVPDFWAASYTRAAGCYGPAYIDVHSGASGATLLTMDARGSTQFFANAIGDIDGDGRPDFIGADAYRGIELFSSLNGRILWETDEPLQGGPGTAISPAGDYDGDGRPDFLVGASAYHSFEGMVELLAANDLWLDVNPSHFPGSGSSLELRANPGPTGNPAVLFLTGVNGAPRFDLLLVTTFDSTGSALFGTGTVPPGLAGNTLTLRALAIDAAGRLIDSIDEEIDFR